MSDERPSWDELFTSMCYLVAQRSPDLSTRVGAVITTPSHEIVSVGYNGMPRGVNIQPDRMTSDNGTKYLWTEHSESNAILNAGRNGVPTIGCKLYVNFLPCAACARAIIQSGIREVITHRQGQDAFLTARGTAHNEWAASHNMVLEMFGEAEVIHRWVDCELIQLNGFFSGQIVHL